MKIIKKGIKIQERSYRWLCSKCDSLIEAQSSEGRKVTLPKKSEDCIIFQCPMYECELTDSKDDCYT